MADKLKFFVNGQKVVIVPDKHKIKYFKPNGDLCHEQSFAAQKVTFVDADGSKIVARPDGKIKKKTFQHNKKFVQLLYP